MVCRLLHRRIFVVIFIVSLTLLLVSPVSAQVGVRNEIRIPDIPGYVTLKCDFHIHTVFSDGDVWPTVRPEEAWREGLDAIAITDHIEYQPHKGDIPMNHNRSYEIAAAGAQSLGIILIKGAEITREMPPGHFNALFIKDASALDTKDFRDALKAAAEQGGFIIWNHPGWRQPNEIPIWYDEHTEIYTNGWMNGMEIFNDASYYPLAHQWCIDKKITLIGSSDTHSPINLQYDFYNGEHRPMTLVFAEKKTQEAIKEALVARRTAVYFGNTIVGEEQFLKPLFSGSIKLLTSELTITGRGSANAQIYNDSDVGYELVSTGAVEGIRFPQSIVIPGMKTVLCRITNTSDRNSGIKTISFPYRVKNLLTAPDTELPVEFLIKVTFLPARR
jgi:hypothetical protein